MPRPPQVPYPARVARTARAVSALLVAVFLVSSACGSSRSSSGTTAPASSSLRGSGPVDVLYAGSLVNLMQQHLGPAFHGATGFSVVGYSAGSSALASQIKGHVRRGDVFLSASPSVNASLQGPANGNWVSWYVTFATSPLLIAYNPHSRFASALRTQPWYRVVAEHGFLLGRTDPETDPKGKLAVQALDKAASAYGEPALAAIAKSSSGEYPEETLIGRLEAGELDAGFFYLSEATPAGLPTVPLTGLSPKADYTVTVLRGAPHPTGADAFVSYLLGPRAESILSSEGFDLVTPPAMTGTGLPPEVQSAIAGTGE